MKGILGLLVWAVCGAAMACTGVRERAAELRAELDQGFAAEKTPGTQAAAALLAGNLRLAAWAGLTAAEAGWNGKTVADAGVYLYYLDKHADALRFLHCALSLGQRSPFVFEALASVHEAQGAAAEARAAIAEAQRLAPGDPLIHAAASILETGKPPPAARPDGKDGAARCIAALEEHSRRVLAVRKQNHARYDRLQNLDSRAQAIAGQPQIHQDLIQHVREVASMARRAGDAMQHNTALAQCATAYFSFSTFLLDSYYVDRSGFELVFWADVMGLDAPVFVRDLPCGSPGNDCGARVLPQNSLLSRQAEDRRHFGREEAARQYRRELDACRAAGGTDTCPVRAAARECAANKASIEQWADARQQRVNTASRNFDDEARYVVSLAEGEIAAAREFAVGLLRDLRKGGPAFPGPDGRKMDAAGFAVWQINQTYTQMLLQPHLLAGGKVEQFLQEQSRWFGHERSWIEEGIALAKRDHDQHCEPVMLQMRLLQLQEQYQAYLEHLRERMRWGVDSRVDTKFPCDCSLGGFKCSTDLNDLGETKFGYEVSRDPYAGTVEVGKDGPSFSGSASGKIRGVGVSVDSGGAAGASGRYGPFAGKADATFTTARNPWNNREYLGIRVKGSAGFGVGNKAGTASASCYPASGEVTIYPRALLEDVGRYLSAKSR